MRIRSTSGFCKASAGKNINGSPKFIFYASYLMPYAPIIRHFLWTLPNSEKDDTFLQKSVSFFSLPVQLLVLFAAITVLSVFALTAYSSLIIYANSKIKFFCTYPQMPGNEGAGGAAQRAISRLRSCACELYATGQQRSHSPKNKNYTPVRFGVSKGKRLIKFCTVF